MPLIHWKIELKLKWTKNCVLAAAGVDDVNTNDIILNFTIKDKKLYVPVVTLSAKDNQKLSKLLSKGFERSMYWNEYKIKSVLINFISNNVKGFQSTNKKLKLIKYFKDKIVSNCFLFLEETHSTINDEIKWKDDFKGEVFHSHGKSNSCFDLFHML